MAWQCMAEKKTVTHYHIIPRAGSRNKRLSPGNMLQGSVHQFFSQALPSMSTECQGGGEMSWVRVASSRTVVGLSNGREVNWPLTREPANGNPRGHWPLDPPPRVRLFVTIIFKSHISCISTRFKTILYQNLILCADVAMLISDFVGHLAILWNAQFLCPSSILVL